MTCDHHEGRAVVGVEVDVTLFPEVGIRVVGAGAIVEAGVKTIVDLHHHSQFISEHNIEHAVTA